MGRRERVLSPRGGGPHVLVIESPAPLNGFSGENHGAVRPFVARHIGGRSERRGESYSVSYVEPLRFTTRRIRRVMFVNAAEM
jgi:hypothetical protein